MADDTERLEKWFKRAESDGEHKPSPTEKYNTFLENQEREQKTARSRLFWRETVPVYGAALLVAGLVVSCGIHVFTHDPTTTPEWQKEYREVQRKEAARCQELFAYWHEGMITDKQTKKLQKCVDQFKGGQYGKQK